MKFIRRQRQLVVAPLSGPLSLRLNFQWTFVGNMIYAAAQWGMLVVLAKVGSPEMVGQFSLGLAITAPVIMLTNLQLRAVQATDAKNEYQFGDYLSLRLIMNFLAALIIISIVFISGYQIQTALVVIAVAVAKIVESVNDIIYGLMQKHERMDRIAISMILKGLFSLVIFGGLIWTTTNVILGALGLAVTWLVLLCSYDLGNARRLVDNYLNADVPALWRLTRLAFPLGVVMMLLSLSTNIPRYFIVHYRGEQELGYFAAMAYLMIAGTMVVTALGQSASPRLSQYYVAGNITGFWRLLFKLVGIGAVLGAAGVLVVVLLGREILTLFYRPDYGDHVDVFVWLMVAAGNWYVASMLGYGATARRSFKLQPVVLCFVVLISIGACQLLVPEFGMLGAAYASVISSVVGVIGYAALNVKR